MRSLAALVAIFCVLAGCRASGGSYRASASMGGDSGIRYVALSRLARDLDLHYRGEETSGFIELSTPPDNVMLVCDSTRCLVNGREIAMQHPCLRRGEDYVLSSEDAEMVTRALQETRPVHRTPPPPPDIQPDRPRVAPPSGLPSDWRPAAHARDWKYIVIHHQASARGSAAAINRIHMSKGWDGLGYHFVIGNGSLTADGAVEVGYRWKNQSEGAHARVSANDDNWWNLHSIGICLVGDFTKERPSERQLESLARLVRALQAEYGIPTERVIPHDAVKDTLCPGPRFPWDRFLQRLR